MEVFKSLLMTGLSAVRFVERTLFQIQTIKGSWQTNFGYVFELQKRDIYVAGLNSGIHDKESRSNIVIDEGTEWQIDRTSSFEQRCVQRKGLRLNCKDMSDSVRLVRFAGLDLSDLPISAI